MAVTISSRAAGMMIGAALVVGWMSASLTQGPPPAQSSRPGGSRFTLGGSAPIPRAEKLRERLTEPPQPARGRNPFAFGSRAPRSRGVEMREGREAEAPVEMTAIAPVEPPLPVFKLSGIAMSTENGAAVLTAIVIDNGAMVFAKAGDRLSNGHTVVRVDEHSVTLVDAAGVTQTLRLP